MGTNAQSHLQGIIAELETLQNQVVEERGKSSRIAQDYIKTRQILENRVRELQEKLAIQHSELEASKGAYIELRKKAEKELEQLQHYQASWAEVLRKEQMARNIFLEYQEIKKTLPAVVAERKESQNRAEYLERELTRALENHQLTQKKYEETNQKAVKIHQYATRLQQHVQQLEGSFKSRVQQELQTLKAQAYREISEHRDGIVTRAKTEVAEQLKSEWIDKVDREKLESNRLAREVAAYQEELRRMRTDYELVVQQTEAQLRDARKERLEKVLELESERRTLHHRIEELELSLREKSKAEATLQFALQAERLNQEREKQELHKKILREHLHLEKEAERLRAEKENLQHTQVKIVAINLSQKQPSEKSMIVDAIVDTLPA